MHISKRTLSEEKTIDDFNFLKCIKNLVNTIKDVANAELLEKISYFCEEYRINQI